jgi:hypothetical protein
MEQVAVPVLSVVAVHVSVPFNVIVTGSPGTGVLVVVSVRTAETVVGCPTCIGVVGGCTTSDVGVAETTVGASATRSSPLTDMP